MIIYNYLFGIRVNILHSPTPPPWGRVAPQTVEVQRGRGGIRFYKESTHNEYFFILEFLHRAREQFFPYPFSPNNFTGWRARDSIRGLTITSNFLRRENLANKNIKAVKSIKQNKTTI